MSVTFAFKHEMEASVKKRRSNVVLALDLPLQKRGELLSKTISILDDVHPFVCAVKLGYHSVLTLGPFDHLQKVLTLADDYELPTIMDCKLNDVGHVNKAMADLFFKVGFKAVTANPFIGWEEGLQPVFEVAHRNGRGVLILVHMSHEGAAEGYGRLIWDQEAKKAVPQYVIFARKALSWKADGAVVGATFPKRIKEMRDILGDEVPIYSPGVGAQGGRAEEAVRAGARYLIVGRAITLAKEPAEAAKALKSSIARQFSALT